MRLLTLLTLVLALPAVAHGGELSQRWFFLSTNLNDDGKLAAS